MKPKRESTWFVVVKDRSVKVCVPSCADDVAEITTRAGDKTLTGATPKPYQTREGVRHWVRAGSASEAIAAALAAHG